MPDDAQSTTGPMPPRNTIINMALPAALDTQKTISGVPAYIWYRGCGPTSVGMVVGYYDGKGFGNLVTGSAATQTASANSMISSSGNYDDYCLPMDSPPNLLKDKSELPVGDEHANDCVADYMRTSQSYCSNYYGWAWYSDVPSSFINYVKQTEPACQVTATNRSWSSLTWASFCAEIDASRPVVFLVDSDGDGATDHFIPAIGYGVSAGVNMYACLNTWDTAVHWYSFSPMQSGHAWGIYGATFFTLTAPTVASAKLTANNAAASIHGATVAAAFTDYFYVESPDRSCGLRVRKVGHSFTAGMRVDASGTMKVNTDGERYLDASYSSQDGTAVVRPLLVRASTVGGDNWRYSQSTGAGQRGIYGAKGLNNIGMLVRVCGKVRYKGTDSFYIDDGSRAADNSGHPGIKVYAPGLFLPDEGQIFKVTGISTCFQSGGNLYRQIWARGQSDIAPQ